MAIDDDPLNRIPLADLAVELATSLGEELSVQSRRRERRATESTERSDEASVAAAVTPSIQDDAAQLRTLVRIEEHVAEIRRLHEPPRDGRTAVFAHPEY